MATRAQTRAATNIKSMLAAWAGLTQASLDSGDAMNVEGALYVLVMLATGTLGAGGNVIWEGSTDGVNWFTLSSDIGAPAAVNQTALLVPVMVKERTRFIRPRVTAGDGTTALVAHAVATFA